MLANLLPGVERQTRCHHELHRQSHCQTRRIAIQPQLLAKVVVILSRHRDLYNDLVETPLLLPELEAAFATSTPSQPPPDRGWSTNLPPAGGLGGPPAAAPTDSTGSGEKTLLDKYRTSRQLRKLLQAGDVFFAKRSLVEVKLYLYLTTTAESGSGGHQPDTTHRWREQLRSGDPTKIRSAAAELRADSPDAWADTVVWLETLAGSPAEPTRPAANAALAFSHDDPIAIPAGDYPVGTRGSTRRVEGFKINRYPVTNAWYRLFLADSQKSPFPGHIQRFQFKIFLSDYIGSTFFMDFSLLVLSHQLWE